MGSKVDPGANAARTRPDCEHEFVDRIIRVGVWKDFTKLVIYCKRCGLVSCDKHI